MLDSVFCPECNRRIELGREAITALEEKRGRECELECPDGHIFSLHEGVVKTRLKPSLYSVFWHIQGIEHGHQSTRVGEWRIVRLSKPFEKIDEITTVCFPEEEGLVLPGVRSEARFDGADPTCFWLMTSGNEAEWGQRVRINWTAYGAVPTSLDIWRENLIFAARQFLAANHRPCVIQSAVAVESFVYDFVIDYLEGTAHWSHTTVQEYIHGASRDSLPLQGVIRVCIQEMMGLRFSQDIWAGWRRLKQMRDALAHGDLSRYMQLTDSNGQRFVSEQDRARFAYQAAVRFIYEIRYPGG